MCAKEAVLTRRLGLREGIKQNGTLGLGLLRVAWSRFRGGGLQGKHAQSPRLFDPPPPLSGMCFASATTLPAEGHPVDQATRWTADSQR